MTLEEFLKNQPADRIAKLKAGDREEAKRMVAEFKAAKPAHDPEAPAAAPARVNSFTKAELPKFLTQLETLEPVLHSRIKNGDAAAAREALELDAKNFARFQSNGLNDLGEEDLPYYRWAKARGLTEGKSVVEAFTSGLGNFFKGAAGTAARFARAAGSPQAQVEFAATAVEGAQINTQDYKALGAGAAVLWEKAKGAMAQRTRSSHNPLLTDAAEFELQRYAQQQQAEQGSWRRAISESFAQIPVDPNEAEFLGEVAAVDNLAGAGLGRAVVKRGMRAGLVNEAAGSMLLKEVGRRKVVPLVGQAEVLVKADVAAREVLAGAEAKLADARRTMNALPEAERAAHKAQFVDPIEAEFNSARAAWEKTNSQLQANRAAVTAELDSAGIGLTERALGGTAATVGSGIETVGKGMTRAYNAVFPRTADEAADEMLDQGLDAATKGTTAALRQGNLVTRVGRDIRVLGELYAAGESSLPFFARVRQSRQVGRLTRGAAALADESRLAWMADGAADLAKAGAAGMPVSGAFGYVASGGDAAAAAESAGFGFGMGVTGGAYGQWEMVRDPKVRTEELLGNRRNFRSWLQDSGDRQGQLQIFDTLDATNQLLISTYAHAHPDAQFIFTREGRNGPAGSYDRESNLIRINVDHPDPLAATFAHEISHYIERHGLANQVRDAYLGNAETGQIGQYTKIGPDGKPVVREEVQPDGTKRQVFEINDEGLRLKESYESRVRAFRPDFVLSPEAFASELFAEQYADQLRSGEFVRDLKRSPVDALVNSKLVKGWLGKVGVVFDQNDKIVGTGLFGEIAKNKKVAGLIREWNRQTARGTRPDIAEDADIELTEEQLRDSELAVKWLQAGGAVKFDADGKPVMKDGRPQFLTAKEADQIQKDLAAELTKALDAYALQNPEDGDVVQKRPDGSYSGSYLPQEVIDQVAAQRRFNPYQLATLRAASQMLRQQGPGSILAHFYQAAQKKGSRGYKSVAGRWRRDAIYGIRVTKDGNILMQSFSWEQLFENARKAAKTKRARELWADSGVAVEDAIVADVQQYLRNLESMEPGATVLGDEKRDFINNLLGIRMASTEGVNPEFNRTAQPKTIITSLRLDRMNRLTPLDVVEYAWGVDQYQRAKNNFTPGSSGLPVPLKDAIAARRVDGRQEGDMTLGELMDRLEDDRGHGDEYLTEVTRRLISDLRRRRVPKNILVDPAAQDLIANELQARAKALEDLESDAIDVESSPVRPKQLPAPKSESLDALLTKVRKAVRRNAEIEDFEPVGEEGELIKAIDAGLNPVTALIKAREVLRRNAEIEDFKLVGEEAELIKTIDEIPIVSTLDRVRKVLRRNAEIEDGEPVGDVGQLLKAIEDGLDPVVALNEARKALRSVAEIRNFKPVGEAGELIKAIDALDLTPDTSEFKEWFEGSKAVDETGRPVVLYHGSPVKGIGQFKDDTVFLTDSFEVADGYTAKRGLWMGQRTGEVYPLFASIKNPLVIDALSKNHDNIPVPWQEWKPKVFGNLPKGAVSVADAARYAKENGYDGLIVRNVRDGASFGDLRNSTVYAVFSPAQVKSASGNRGTFDPTNPDIRFSPGSQVETPEFKKWFGDSKVVDADGKPLVVYHGTNQDFSVFEKNRLGKNTGNVATKGFFFSESAPEANEYAAFSAKRQLANAPSVERRVEQIKKEIARAERFGDWDKVEKLTAEWEDLELGAVQDTTSGANVMPVFLNIRNPFVKDYQDSMDTYDLASEIAKAKEGGFDGLKLLNVYDPVGDRPGAFSTTQWIAFEPTQIKSAIGNRGTFDPTNPSILMSPGVATIDQVGDQAYEGIPLKDRYSDQRYPEAIPLTFSVDRKGNVVVSKDGPKLVTRPYDFYESPVVAGLGIAPEVLASLKTKLNVATLGEIKGGYLDKLEPAERQALDKIVDAYSTRAVDDFARYAKVPEVKAAAGWYSEIAEFFKRLMPDAGDRTMFLEFLGGTSPNTSVEQNFLYALDLFNRWKKGELDKNLAEYRRVRDNFEQLASPYAERVPVLLESGKQKTAFGQPVFEWKLKDGAEAQFRKDFYKALVADGVKPDAARKRAGQFSEANLVALLQIQNGVIPRRVGGGKYGVHTGRILQILDGVWRSVTDAPKAPNFTENLAGISTRATIDVWAARWLRRIGHDGLSQQPWRILPMMEQGVGNSDFFLGQEIFEETTRRLNERFSADLGRSIQPDDLQAIMWFAEKREWKSRGWAKFEDLGDFRQYTDKLVAQPDGTFTLNGVVLNSTSPDFLSTLAGVEIVGGILQAPRRNAWREMVASARKMRDAVAGEALDERGIAAATEKFLAAYEQLGQQFDSREQP